MSTMIHPSPPAGLTIGDVYRLDIEEYERLAASGGIDEDAPIELLDGVLVKKMTRYPIHAACCRLCFEALAALVPAGFLVFKEDPIRLPPSSVPEPDIAIIRGAQGDFTKRHPGPSEVVLIVEVADSSLARDRGLKRDVYARAGIPNYWVVNLVDRRIEVFADPKDGAYATTSVSTEGGSVELTVDGTVWGRVEVAAVLP